MAVVDRTAPRLQIGRVVVLTFQAIRENILLFSILSLITAVPSFFAIYEGWQLSADVVFTNSYLVAAIAWMVSGYLLTAGITRAIVLERAARRPSLKTCFAEMARNFYPLAAIAIITSSTSTAAFIIAAVYPLAWLLLVPGLFIDVMLFVVVPVRIVEQTGFIATFKRGAELTRGSRWPIFALVVVFIVVGIGSQIMVYDVVGDPAFAESENSGLAALLCLILADMVYGIIGATLEATIYFELRLIKEGVASERLAEVFD